MSRTIASPAIVDADGQILEFAAPVELTPGRASGLAFSEKWLQDLIQRNPRLLPADQIEPAFDELYPVCVELPVRSGFIDNLFVTPSGKLLLAECKLWRNPESRRKVVAQILDYANDVSRMTYESLTSAINSANGTSATNPLYDLVSGHPNAPGEQVFHDLVLRNLRGGRFLLAAVGDGIQEGVEDIAAYMQRYLSLGFTLALVELKLYRLSGKQILAIPYVVARTRSIERSFVRIEVQGVAARAVELTVAASEPPPAKSNARGASITDAEFFESVETATAGFAGKLRAFVEHCETMNIVSEVNAGLRLAWSPDAETNYTLGFFNKKGVFFSSYANGQLDKLGQIDLAHCFQIELAAALGGEVKKTAVPREWYARMPSGYPTISDISRREPQVLEVFRNHLDRLRQLSRS